MSFTRMLQEAAWRCTPEVNSKGHCKNNLDCKTRDLVLEKRRLRRVWHTTRHPADKRALNRACRDLKRTIIENENTAMEQLLVSLSPCKESKYSLWKATRTNNKPQVQKPPLKKDCDEWARSSADKAETFAIHLSNVFTPNSAPENRNEDFIDDVLNQDFQLDLPIKATSPREVWAQIRKLKDKSAPGYDLITPKLLKELPKKAIVFLATLFNGLLRVGYFPMIWKVSQIIMIHKPGKPASQVTSYRPISLLPVLSKVFERILLQRLSMDMASRQAIPEHQFGFRPSHSTTEQVHRVCDKIRETLERKEYCSSAFLDIQQAFDKVWHKGLLYKIKLLLSHKFYSILNSYLSDRIFQVKEEDARSGFYDIRAGVPQGSVLGPTLYSLFTSDLPRSDDVVTATYADDTAILVSHKDPDVASQRLQTELSKINDWLTTWRIRASASKSTQVTFALKHGNCPPVKLSDEPLPHSDSVKYLGMHLDRRLTWRTHIRAKREELNHRYRDLHWLLGRKSKLSLDNKLLIYKAVLKPVWTYCIQLWGSASHSNIEIIQRYQNMILKSISNAPLFIRNSEIHQLLGIPTVKEEIESCNTTYRDRLEEHPNQLARQLLLGGRTRRLKRRSILDI